MDIVKKLLSVVVRTYYDDRHVLLYEYLLNNSP